jgi:hypothetical protein
MQHGKSGAELPRHLARQQGKSICDGHNSEQRVTYWVCRLTGKQRDRSRTFLIERLRKKRQVSIPA